MLTPDRKLGITVRRAGENKDYQVTVAKAPLALIFRQVESGELPPVDQRIDLAYGTPRGEVRVGRARRTRRRSGDRQWPAHWRRAWRRAS